jgi:hypothetical protein
MATEYTELVPHAIVEEIVGQITDDESARRSSESEQPGGGR